MENIFNTKLRDNPDYIINPDLSISHPGALKKLFGVSKLDNATLFENLKKSMSAEAKTLSPEDRSVFSDNLAVLDEAGDLTTIQITVLQAIARKS